MFLGAGVNFDPESNLTNVAHEFPIWRSGKRCKLIAVEPEDWAAERYHFVPSMREYNEKTRAFVGSDVEDWWKGPGGFRWHTTWLREPH